MAEDDSITSDSNSDDDTVLAFACGGGEIRTRVPKRDQGFRDLANRPLWHPSN